MHRAVPALRVVIKMREDGEVRAILLQRSQRLADRVVVSFRRREESTRPKTKVIADADLDDVG